MAETGEMQMGLEIAAIIRLPTSESETEDNAEIAAATPPKTELRRHSGLRTRQRKDYDQMHSMGTSGSESEDTKPLEEKKKKTQREIRGTRGPKQGP